MGDPIKSNHPWDHVVNNFVRRIVETTNGIKDEKDREVRSRSQ